MSLFITFLLLCSLSGSHLKLDPNHIHSCIQSGLPKICQKKLNMKIVFLSHLLLIDVYVYEQFSVEDSLALPAGILLSYLITESIKQ